MWLGEEGGRLVGGEMWMGERSTEDLWVGERWMGDLDMSLLRWAGRLGLARALGSRGRISSELSVVVGSISRFLALKNFLPAGCLGFSGTLIIFAEATVTIGDSLDWSEVASTEESDGSVRDLKNFFTLGTPGLGLSPLPRKEVKEVAPHFPTIPADLAATGLLHCSFIILSKGLPDLADPFLA